MLLSDLAIVRRSGDQGRGDLLECRIEWLVVEEDPVVVVAAVETVLDLTDRACNIPHIRVTGQGHESCIHARAGCRADQILPLRRAGLSDQWAGSQVLVRAGLRCACAAATACLLSIVEANRDRGSLVGSRNVVE